MPAEDRTQSFFLPEGSEGYKKQMENLHDEYLYNLAVKKAIDRFHEEKWKEEKERKKK